MVDAVIVSTARTGIGKAYRGALNNTEGPTMAGHVMAEAVKRAGIEPGEVEDVLVVAVEVAFAAHRLEMAAAVRTHGDRLDR